MKYGLIDICQIPVAGSEMLSWHASNKPSARPEGDNYEQIEDETFQMEEAQSHWTEAQLKPL